jgi:hypothetical protein
MTPDWPVAELDPIRSLKVMATTIPGAVLSEIVVPAPFDRTWAAAADLETALPLMIRDFRSVHVTQDETERIRVEVRGRLGQRARFDVVLRPGWCWMQSRLWVGGIAARPESAGTRIGFLGGLRVPGAGLMVRGLRPTAQRLSRAALHRLAEKIKASSPET